MISSWHSITGSAAYNQKRFDDIRRLEGTNKGRPYLDTTGNSSVGIGFNLRGNRIVRDDVFLRMQINPNFTGLSTAQQAAERGYIAQLNSAMAASYASTTALQQTLDRIMGSRARDPLFAGISRITNLMTFIMTDPQMQAVFSTAAQDAESKVDAWLAGIPPSNERVALVSLAYNNLIGIDSSGQFKSPALRQAIINNDRAEAWYQIRYESNGGQSRIKSGPGIATRRYVESDLLGLYNGAGQPQTEGEAINILRVLRAHQNTIDKYEAQFSVADAGSQYFRLQLQPTYGYLISHFNLGGSPEQVLVSLSVLGGDPIQGGAHSELLLGDISHDILVGGGGDDVLVGGQGKDVYVYNSGDGQDTIFDSDSDISGNGVSDGDRQGLVVFDHHLLAGGVKKQSEGVYKSLDGQITYQRSGSDLVVNGTLTIKEWQEGQFGIRLKELPDDPEAPEENAVGREYKRIDHYVQVGVNADGQPIMAPVFVDFFDDGPNNSSDSSLVPPIGDENNAISALGGNDFVSTGSGNDFINGGAGNDSLNSGGGADTLFGGNGDDSLVAGAGDDWLRGGMGNDGLSGGDDKDQLFGEEGDDSLNGGKGNDRLVGGTGKDTLDGEAGDDYVTVDGPDVTSEASEQVAVGGTGSDVVIGGAGRDWLFGDTQDHSEIDLHGDDWIDGGAGDDGGDLEHGLQGGGGSDTLFGGEGNDWLFGDGPNNPGIPWNAAYDGKDYLDGGTGDDELAGGGDDDILVGGLGNDHLFGDNTYPAGVTGNDVLYGDDGDDGLQGMDGNDVLFGGTGDDILWGDDPNEPSATGDDFLDGGEGIDFLVGGTGTDIVLGGDGDDTLYAGKYDDPHADEADILRGEGGNDVLYGEGGADTMLEGAGDDVLIGDDVFFLDLFDVIQFVASSASGNDVLDGGAGNDRVYGSGGSDTLSGGDGHDLLMGDDYVTVVAVSANNPFAFSGAVAGSINFYQSSDNGNDVLDGGEGNDVLLGGGGTDTLFGGTGDDYLIGDYSGTAFMAGVLGNDLLDGGDGDDALFGGVGADQLLGGTGDDQLLGEEGDDTLDGGDGNDVLEGGVGHDVLVGGAGIDQLSGWDGQDVLDGGSGDEVLRGGHGSDTYVFGLGYGQDRIEEFNDGGTSVVQMAAGVAPSVVSVRRIQDKDMGIDDLVLTLAGSGDSLTLAGAGLPGALPYVVQFTDGTMWNAAVLQDKARQVTATDAATTVTGFDDSDDLITGSSGINVLYASAGNDVLNGGAGQDVLYGGSGDDTYQFGHGSERDAAFDRTGTLNTLEMGGGISPADVAVLRQGQHLDLVVTGTNDRMTLQYFMLGGEYQPYSVQFSDGTIWNAAALLARIGQGVVAGTDGDDVLASTPSAYVLAGGAGNDTYTVNDVADTVVEQIGEGIDVVQSAVSFTIGEQVEQLFLTGVDSIDGVGNSLDNSVTGNSASNVLDGRAGADLMVGGTGDDVYRVDQVGDVVSEGVNEGIDTVESQISYQLGDNVENLTLVGSAAIDGTGNELSNTVTGNDAANVLNGAGGADTLIGQEGDDTYLVRLGDAVIEEAAGGTDTVVSGQSYTLGAQVENLTLVGSAAIDGTGNVLSNVLVGNAATNVLSGGAGDDAYVVGEGDSVVELANEGLDTVVAAQSYVLGANVENLSLVGVDAIDGTGNELENILRGNAGDNVLSGGMGSDSYVFDRGFGQDTVIEDDATVGVSDTVQMSGGILSSDVDVSRTGDDLVLMVRGTSDQITIQSYFTGTAHQIEQVAFDDGTVWDTEALLDHLPSVVEGTSGADVLYGTSGDNTLTGEAGNDRLYGYAGNDAYVFASGFGQDVILDFDASSGNVDTIELSGGFAPANATVTRHGEDLVLALNDTTDQLTVQSFFLDAAYAIERVQFSDGTMWDTETLRDKTRVFVQGTAGDDLLESFIMPGGNPDHLLQGGDGDDRLIGDHTITTATLLAKVISFLPERTNC
jgi:Ca2+-binding RTX toxin-like protein/GH24 family phage-related lysozyme (muramidase)